MFRTTRTNAGLCRALRCCVLCGVPLTAAAYRAAPARAQFLRDPTPPTYDQSKLWAVAASPTGRLATVGFAREFTNPGSRYYPLVMEKQSPSDEWVMLSVPDFGSTWYETYDVAYIPNTNDDLVAIGEYGPDPLFGYGHGFVLRWHRDAGVWDLFNVSVPGYLFHFVRDAVIDPTDPDVLWIAGTKGMDDGTGYCFHFEVLIVRYHLPTNTYTVVPTTQLGGLSGVVPLPDGRVFGFGIAAYECDYLDYPLGVVTDGATVTVLPNPPSWPTYPVYRFNDATRLAEGDICVVGMASKTLGSHFITMAYRYDPDNGNWTTLKPLDPDTYNGPSGYYNQLFDVVEAPDGSIWAAGRYHEVYQGLHHFRGLLERFDGRTWTVHSLPADMYGAIRTELWGLDTTPAGQIFAAGLFLDDYPDVTLVLKSALAPGDMNCDGVVNFDDIDPFVLALADPAGYSLQYPGCNVLNGDTSGNGSVDFDDVGPFVELLSGG